MSRRSPAVILYDAAGVPLAVADGVAIPGGTPGLIFAGKQGSNSRFVLVDTLGRLITAPAGTASTTKGFSFGQVVLAATTVVPIRATTYTEQTSNAQRSIASASANDTAAGTGARKVKITYYTATLTGPFTETVTLNGTTYVNTSNSDICFIEKMEVTEVGSGLVSAGIITLKAATAGGGATIWTIPAAANQTHGAHHYVPVSTNCFITSMLFGIKGADTTGGFLRSQAVLTANAAEVQISDFIRVPSSGQSARNFGTPVQVAGPARIIAYAAPDSTSSRTYYASFDFYEEAA